MSVIDSERPAINSRSGEEQKKGTSQEPKSPRRNRGRRPARQSGRQRHIYSAIDLGTNNCRLLVARPVHGGFKVIDAFSRIVRLGEGLATSGVLSEEAIEKTIEALKVCATKIRRRRVTRMRHVATEACRVAGNCDEFVARVRRETGIDLDVIDAREEARLAVMGCQTLLDEKARRALVFDIGGGSTEVIWVSIGKNLEPHILGWTSIPYGVVSLSERYLVADRGTVYDQMVDDVAPFLETFAADNNILEGMRRHSTQLLGTSGTVTTLASLYLGLKHYDRSQVDGSWLRTERVRDLSRSLADMSQNDRADIPAIGPERADLVIAGCAILEAILQRFDAPRLRVADRGIREGILRTLMRRDPLVNAGRPAEAQKQSAAGENKTEGKRRGRRRGRRQGGAKQEGEAHGVENR